MFKSNKKINIKINNLSIKAEEGKSLLEICKENNIEIAHLCQHDDFEKSEAVCRLCMVKFRKGENGHFTFSPACSLYPTPDMEIITNDAEIARTRKTILELLFIEHAGLCHNCSRNLECELQTLAIKYSINQFRFVPRSVEISSEEDLERLRDKLQRRVIDLFNPSIARDSAKCVECRRCIKTCSEIQNINSYSCQKRGYQMGIGTEHYTPLECTYCGQCSLHCPTASITEKSDLVSVVKALKDPKKIVIAQTAPSVRVTLGEEFGMLPGTLVTGKMVSALRDCGFKIVFDVNTGADLTIIEEASELIDRIKNDNSKEPLPLFTSCCPAWMLFCEQNYPEILKHVSTTRSPQMMMGSLIKTYYANKIKTSPKNIVVVSIMPCTAKKYEAQRPEFSHKGVKDVDYVLTVRELARLIKNLEIKFDDLPDSEFDQSLGISTGAALIFGTSGGVTEAAARTAYFYLTGKSLPDLELEKVRGSKGIHEAQIKIGRKNLRLAVVHGLKNARKIVEMVKKKECEYDFIEIMACPGGCIAGGGQPYPINSKIRNSRIKALYSTDKKMALRESHKNPIIKQLYKEFLYNPGSRKAKKLLHTEHYKYDFPLRKEHMKK